MGRLSTCWYPWVASSSYLYGKLLYIVYSYLVYSLWLFAFYCLEVEGFKPLPFISQICTYCSFCSYFKSHSSLSVKQFLYYFFLDGVWNVGGLMQTYADGKTTMSVYERKASIREFYGKVWCRTKRVWVKGKWMETNVNLVSSIHYLFVVFLVFFFPS